MFGDFSPYLNAMIKSDSQCMLPWDGLEPININPNFLTTGDNYI